MEAFGHILEAADLVMVVALALSLRCCWRCRVLWTIQLFQLGEVLDLYMHHNALVCYFGWTQVNLLLEFIVCLVAYKHFRVVCWLSALHVYLKVLARPDTIYDYHLDAMDWANYWINVAILVALLGYAVREVMACLQRSEYVRRTAQEEAA